jgi:hypothetical protein
VPDTHHLLVGTRKNCAPHSSTLCPVEVPEKKTDQLQIGGNMPIISIFYGIIIRMYLLDNKHNLPHIHAKYAEFEASVGIDDGEILA